MCKRKMFKTKLVMGVSGLAGLLIFFLLLHYSGRPSIRITEASSTFQSQSETQRLWAKPPAAINTPTATNASNTVLALDKEDLEEEETVQSLVNPLFDDDIEELKELTWKDFLFDKERDDVNPQIVKYLKETAAVVPRMIELRSSASELETALYLMQISGPLYQTSREEQKKVRSKIGEVYDELDPLQRRAVELDSFLTNKDNTSIRGDVIDTDKIEQLYKELWDGKGWYWYDARAE